MHVSDAVLAQRPLQFVHADVLSRHMRLDGLSIVNQKTGLALNYAAKAAVDAGKSAYKIVQQQQCGSGDHAAEQRGVRPRHGILHGIGKKQQQRQIERSHLSDFTFAAETYPDQYDKINDYGA